MADVWLPGVYRDHGRNAGYNAGHSQMVRAVAHYTVGADSRNVGRDGYFHFLVHRDASREHGCTQYAEVDAITWHAADAGNPYGPGVEWERMVTGGINAEGLSEAEPLTENQLEWGARLVDYFAEWGIPPQLYDGPRYVEESWRGWVNHQAIDSSRSDGLLRWEWDAMTGGEIVTREDMETISDMTRDKVVQWLNLHGTAPGLQTVGETWRETLDVARKNYNAIAALDAENDERA